MTGVGAAVAAAAMPARPQARRPNATLPTIDRTLETPEVVVLLRSAHVTEAAKSEMGL
jgi:hypothetical protein